jgi:hypothetical protein
MEIVRASEVQQFSSGFKLLVTFSDDRADKSAPVHNAAIPDTWMVRVVKPDGTGYEKTADLEFPDAAVAEIAFPVDPLDLDLAGEYTYQVIRTTASANAMSAVATFSVIPSLPDGVPLSQPSSPNENFFPIYNAQGGLTNSLLEDDAGTLRYNGVPIGGSGSALTSADLIIGETPSGLVNGSNATYTTANNFVAGTVEVFVNGVRQKEGAGNDYTTTGLTTINMLTSPQTGDQILVNYIKA